jgi:hypothetical protein
MDVHPTKNVSIGNDPYPCSFDKQVTDSWICSELKDSDFGGSRV